MNSRTIDDVPRTGTEDKPHAIYRLFDADDNLLYIGCSATPGRRFQKHLYDQAWRYEISRIELEWRPAWLDGRRAEMIAIRDERPKYNRLIHDPDAVGTSIMGGPPRGDGLACPRCGNPKKDRRHAYCPSCNTTYQRERRIAAGWLPRKPPTTTCPKCSGPKEPGPSYCKPCQKQVNKDAWIKRKAKKAALAIY